MRLTRIGGVCGLEDGPQAVHGDGAVAAAVAVGGRPDAAAAASAFWLLLATLGRGPGRRMTNVGVSAKTGTTGYNMQCISGNFYTLGHISVLSVH